ncbi:MAG: hypothetical protein VKK63_10350 [Synechococcus sp.]|nr:hypothetical protein [Synechococcus sp.]
MTYCPDPRPLAPPDDPPPPDPEPVWHFLSDDWEHEHWITDPAAVPPLLTEYVDRGAPFTLRQLLDA